MTQGITDISYKLNTISKYPYGIRLPENPGYMFEKLLQQEEHSLGLYNTEYDKSHRLQEWFAILQQNPEDVQIPDMKPKGELPVTDGFSLYTTPNYTDTRVGGNDAINPYWQFNRDDDIVPKMLEIPNVFEGGEQYGMGRVYSERYDANQQILWLSMGVAEYTNLLSFFIDAADKDAADTMRKGLLYGIGRIFRLVVGGVIWAFKFPFMAGAWLYNWIRRSDSTRITKYYWFKPTMTLYYEMCNTMLSYLAVGMGLFPSVIMKRRADSTKMLTAEDAASVSPVYDQSLDGWGNNLKDIQFDGQNTGIPEILRDGPDIFVIMNRRSKLFSQGRKEVTTRQLLQATQDAATIQKTFSTFHEEYEHKESTNEKGKFSWFRRDPDAESLDFWSTIKATMLGAGDFVGFRVEKSSNASESVSNDTGQTGIAQKLNSLAQQTKEKYDDSFGNSLTGRFANKLGDIIANPDQGAADWLKGEALRLGLNLTASFGLGDIGAVVTNGNGYFDIPEVWQNSSFNKSHSFSVDLYSRYGDPVSIYQSIYIPLIMLLAASLPRSVGTSMYTSPFLIKAYCKGQFAIPCGLISSISITRGKEEHGWSTHMLPTQVSVDLSLKDMTPAMFMGMQDIGLFDTFSRNESMHEYLDTLAALGVTERRFLFPQAMRKMTAALAIKRNTLFSSTYWATRVGRSGLAKAIGQIPPFGNHENSDKAYNAAIW